MYIRLIIIFTLFLANIAYANPAPLGIEIGRASIEDVKKKYEIIDSKQNATLGYSNYFLDPQNMPFESVSKTLVMCDDMGIVHGVHLYMGKKQFDDIVDTLSTKYTTITKQASEPGDKFVEFKSGDCTIKAYTLHDEKEMLLSYISSKFQKASNLRMKEEDEAKQSKAKSVL